MARRMNADVRAADPVYAASTRKYLSEMARPEGFEPPTLRFEA